MISIQITFAQGEMKTSLESLIEIIIYFRVSFHLSWEQSHNK